MSSNNPLRHHLGSGFFGGWTPSRPDTRDHLFAPESELAPSIPETFELPGFVDAIPCLNQASEGSCEGHGGAAVVMYDQYKQGEPVVVPSRAMIYYDARIPEGTTDQDAGAMTRDMVAGLAKYGVCTDAEFPYIPGQYAIAPSAQNYAEGQQQAALEYQSVRYPHIDAAIYSGYPVVDGMTVYESMMTNEVAQTGIVPLPGGQTVGGHCTVTFGFNMTREPWTSPSGLVYPPRTKAKRNSWLLPNGQWWGARGNFFLPQKFWDEGLVTDAWVIKRIGLSAS